MKHNRSLYLMCLPGLLLLLAFAYLPMGAMPVSWYAEPKYWKVIILLDVWKWADYNSIIYMAAMAGFDGSLYDAAKIDGAGHWTIFFRIALPLSTMALLTVGLMRSFSSIPSSSGISYGASWPAR